MVKPKVVFLGNPLGGDDGIGPYLFQELKDSEDLKNFDVMELGVIGFDLLAYIEDAKHLIIVDALHEPDNVGEVRLLGEKDLTANVDLVSQHDFGVEETTGVLKSYNPDITLHVIGIAVPDVREFAAELSDALIEKMPIIKKKVVMNILKVGEA